MTTPVRERINIAGVRKRYPVNPVTIWRKIRAGDFPAPHYIGSLRFWFTDEVDTWIAGQMARPAAARRGAKSGAAG